jgi:tetratricopeptide (TPR) repeat protein
MLLKIPFKQKISLVLASIFLCLVLLEICLRLGGFTLSFLQERRNKISLRQKGTYRIMCLGESNTAGQYPSFLEEILNQRNIGIRFSVIDRGVVGTNTSAILGCLELNLNNYHPDMVVTMMGMSDERAKYYGGIDDADTMLFKKSRTYRWLRLIWKHIIEKRRMAVISEKSAKYPQAERVSREAVKFNPKDDEGFFELGRLYRDENKFSQAEDSFKKTVELNPKNDQAYIELGWLYQNQGKFSQAEDSFRKAIELNSENNQAYFELGRFYENQNKLSQAEDAFKKAIEMNPENYNTYLELGRLYQNQGKFSQAEDIFKKAIELNPENYNAYLELGRLYQRQEKFSQMKDSFKKAIELNPKNDRAYFGLGRFYESQGKFSQAEDIFQKAIELNPKNYGAYLELGWFYRNHGKFSQAEDIFKRAIELNPKNERAYGAILVLYEEMGKPELAEEYAEKTNTVRLGYYKPVTVNNHRKLKEILDKRGIRLVCAQYPMRSIGPLKNIFEGTEEGVIFVDNERIFRDAVKKDGFRAYFRDIFAGDFGHCTEKGNRLLAENIARVILKEVFSK